MKTPVPISFRLDGDVRERLADISKRTGIPERTLAQWAITAAVNAIEEADGKLVVPVEFTVKHTPAPGKPAPVLPSARIDLNDAAIPVTVPVPPSTPTTYRKRK